MGDCQRPSHFCLSTGKWFEIMLIHFYCLGRKVDVTNVPWLIFRQLVCRTYLKFDLHFEPISNMDSFNDLVSSRAAIWTVGFESATFSFVLNLL